MTIRSSATDPGLGRSFIVSTVIHLAVFLLVAWYGSRHVPLKVAETYYVDVVNLPVASPQSGSPASREASSQPAPQPPKAAAAPMTLPTQAKAAKPTPAKPAVPAAKQPDSATESASEFAKNLEKMQRTAQARQEEASFEQRLSKISKQGSGRPGMPGAGGKEAGSDYTAYIQSRLKDAFQRTISHTSQSPEMAVRLYIDSDGRLARRKTDRSSGDRAFEISVMRAIDLASEKFPPPPNKKMYEGVFVFKREGIVPNKP
jgi:colicin import membrane protein